MKILLDENIDVRFKKYFPVAYEVFTVKDMGWKGINTVSYCCYYNRMLLKHGL